MSTSRFQVPTIRERGQVASAMAAVQEHKPAAGEAKGHAAVHPLQRTAVLRHPE